MAMTCRPAAVYPPSNFVRVSYRPPEWWRWSAHLAWIFAASLRHPRPSARQGGPEQTESPAASSAEHSCTSTLEGV